MAQALINHKIIPWACHRADMDLDFLASKMKVNVEKLKEWESGESKPTFKQAQKLAKYLHIPFGYLFLKEAPAETVPVTDFRTIANRQQKSLSIDLKDLLNDLEQKQSWYREYIRDYFGEPVNIIGKFSSTNTPLAVATDIIAKLNLTLQDRKLARNTTELYNLLVARIERYNILVMKSGVVGSNTHRALDLEEFRGISMYDDYAPIIFINGRDVPAAQLFTLVHELAHLWIGEGGISNQPLDSQITGSNAIERLCNAVAGEVLVPQDILINHWDNGKTLDEITADLRRKIFRVSQVVIARRAYDIRLISWGDYSEFYADQAKKWKSPKSPGGNPYNTIPIRNSKTFTSAVVQRARANGILLRDAGKLLGVSPARISKLATHIGVS